MVENQGPVEESERVESRRNEGKEEGEKEGMEMEGRMEEPEDAPGEEQRKVNVPLGPSQPTAREIAEHEASGHAVHRSWCVHCTRARGNVQSHPRTDRSGEGEVPALHADYFFLGSSQERDDIIVQTRGCRGQEEELTFGATSGHGTLCGNSEQEC